MRLDVKGVRHLRRSSAVWLVLFFLGLLLFTWPVLTALSEASLGTACLYLHVTWLVIIALVFLATRVDSPEAEAGEVDDV